MNPLCPDPSYPVWDSIAEGCMSAAKHTVENNVAGWYITVAILIAVAICAIRWFDAK